MVVCVTHSTTGSAVWVLVKTSGAALAYATNAAIRTCDLMGLKECGGVLCHSSAHSFGALYRFCSFGQPAPPNRSSLHATPPLK